MEIEELLKIIARLLNVPEAKAKELIEAEDGKDAIAKLNADNLKKKFDEGHKKALGKSTKELVDVFATEFDFDVTGSTPEEIVESIKAGFESRGADEVSEETILASSSYKKLQSELTRAQQDQNKIVEKKVKELLKDKEAEFNKNLKAAKRDSLNTELFSKAEKWLTDKKAVLHADPEKRRKQIQEIVNKLSDLEIEKDSDGYLISKEGKPRTNKDGHNASLDDIFSDYDHLYHFQEVQQRQSTGLPPDGGGTGGGAQFKHFKGEVPKDAAGMSKLQLDYSEAKVSKEAYHEAKTAYEAGLTT